MIHFLNIILWKVFVICKILFTKLRYMIKSNQMKYLFFISILIINNFDILAQSLDQLLQAKKIEVLISHKADNESIDGSNHRGECLKFKVTNKTNNFIGVDMQNGYHIENLTKPNQDLITTDNLIVKLKPNECKEIGVNAFCIQKNESSPKAQDAFRMMGRADAKMIELCKWLQKNKLYNHTAQQAIWCISDDVDLGSIYDTYKDTATENSLVSLVCKLTKRPKPERQVNQDYVQRVINYPVEFEGFYSKDISIPTTTGFYVVDSMNNVITTIIKDDTETRKGTIKYSYHYRGQYPKGVYYLKMKQNNEWILVKNLIVKENS